MSIERKSAPSSSMSDACSGGHATGFVLHDEEQIEYPNRAVVDESKIAGAIRPVNLLPGKPMM